MMDLGPEHDPFTFGVDPDKESDPGNAYSLSLILRDEVFLTSLLISQGMTHGPCCKNWCSKVACVYEWVQCDPRSDWAHEWFNIQIDVVL